MKTLYLLRHAKSSWGNVGLGDFERPLKERGRHAARLIGHYLAAQNHVLELVLCSEAVRARQTLKHVETGYGASLDKLYEQSLYLSSPETMLTHLHRLNDDLNKAMIIAHNPGMQDLALSLPSERNSDAWWDMDEKYPTAALTILTFEGNTWRQCMPGACTLEAYIKPRDLESVTST